MATTFKNFLSNDIANTRTLLHEAIPITGSIVSGTYAGDGNIKTFSMLCSASETVCSASFLQEERSSSYLSRSAPFFSEPLKSITGL